MVPFDVSHPRPGKWLAGCMTNLGYGTDGRSTPGPQVVGLKTWTSSDNRERSHATEAATYSKICLQRHGWRAENRISPRSISFLLSEDEEDDEDGVEDEDFVILENSSCSVSEMSDLVPDVVNTVLASDNVDTVSVSDVNTMSVSKVIDTLPISDVINAVPVSDVINIVPVSDVIYTVPESVVNNVSESEVINTVPVSVISTVPVSDAIDIVSVADVINTVPVSDVINTASKKEMDTDCFISHIEYNIKQKDMKYVLCPDLNYTDSDFEEDSKLVANDDDNDYDDNNKGDHNAAAAPDKDNDDDDDDCCIIYTPDGAKEEVEHSKITANDVDHSNLADIDHSMCEVNTSSDSSLAHFQRERKESPPKTSPRCGSQGEPTFPDQTLFQCYVKQGRKKGWVCEVCERVLRSRYHLMRHMETHTGVKVKSYRCNSCTEIFDRLSRLKEHQKVHIKINLLKVDAVRRSQHSGDVSCAEKNPRDHREPRERCPMCGVWGTSQVVALHTANHLAGRSFICHRCHEGFYSCSKLNFHMRTHLLKMVKRCSSKPSKSCEARMILNGAEDKTDLSHCPTVVRLQRARKKTVKQFKSNSKSSLSSNSTAQKLNSIL